MHSHRETSPFIVFDERPRHIVRACTAALLALVHVPVVAQQDEATSDTLPKVEVIERDIKGYAVTRSAGGMKTDTPIIETPQSISVVGAEEIDTLKAQSLESSLAYVAGVKSMDAGDERLTTSLFIRGFEASPRQGVFYRDGVRILDNYYNGQPEPYGLERIEVLKGASSTLYGAAGPGGLVNMVTKMPTLYPLRELNVSLGSFRHRQVSGDFSDSLGEGGDWSYRLVFLHRDAETYVDEIDDRRTFVAPSLRWQPSATTSLTLLAEYQKDRSGRIFGLPQQGTLRDNPNGRLPRDRFIGEPGYDQSAQRRYTLGTVFEHAFNDQLKLRNTLRYFDAENDFFGARMSTYYGARGTYFEPDMRTVKRQGVDYLNESSSFVADTSFEYTFRHGKVEHTLLAGVDYSRSRHAAARFDRTMEPIDLFNPVYGTPIGSRVPNLRNESWRSDIERLGFYAQDQIKLADKWVFALGARRDRVEQDESSYFTYVKSADNEKSHATSKRFGLVYLADNGLAPFASYSTSFEPTGGIDADGQRFKPTEGEQYELGLRYQPPGSNTLLSAVVYELTRNHVMVWDPANDWRAVQLGEVRSRGFEFEARTRIGRYANLIAAYTYTDARTIESAPSLPEEVGQRSWGVPYNQLSLWADYDLAGVRLPGWRIGAGARYVGSTVYTYTNTVTPSFTVYDAMASYSHGNWVYALNVQNLTDKEYLAGCTYRCFHGTPRKALATATYRW